MSGLCHYAHVMLEHDEVYDEWSRPHSLLALCESSPHIRSDLSLFCSLRWRNQVPHLLGPSWLYETRYLNDNESLLLHTHTCANDIYDYCYDLRSRFCYDLRYDLRYTNFATIYAHDLRYDYAMRSRKKDEGCRL